ncbi:amino acid permease [Actinoplanes sp. NPDC051470]|uniref:APC family permease n=1 Tax=unclassified Actinoplanes TaxID=2626549 RepID=UPI003441E5A7
MSISATRGVALYVGALLGPGLLVLPGLAAATAGPASILAWAGLLVLSGLVAAVFAMLGPSPGGVAGYVRRGLGDRAGRAVGWCFLAGIISGAPVVCQMGAAYLGLGPAGTALAGGLLLLVVLALTSRGVHTSTSVQLVLVGVLIVVVLIAIVGAAPSMSATNWTPFAPHGWPAIGDAAVVLMLSFVGWEAIAPLTDRFADPRRRLPRVIAIAFAITAVVYLALAAVTIGTAATTDVPFATLLAFPLGAAGPAVAAAGAVVLTIGTANAYLSGGVAMAGARWFFIVVVAVAAVELTFSGLGHLPVTGAVTVATTFFLAVYLGCMAAAVRLLRGVRRWIAATAGVAVVVVLSFAGYALLPALAVVAAALITRSGRLPAQVSPRRSSPQLPRRVPRG